MELTFGKYRGESLERVLLRDPGYVFWMFNVADPSGRLAAAADEARRLIAAFDERPLVGRCTTAGCPNPVARATVSPWDGEVLCWCAGCLRFVARADGQGRQAADTYTAAAFVAGAPHRPGDRRDRAVGRAVCGLALAKGLPWGADEEQLRAFFRTAVGV